MCVTHGNDCGAATLLLFLTFYHFLAASFSSHSITLSIVDRLVCHFLFFHRMKQSFYDDLSRIEIHFPTTVYPLNENYIATQSFSQSRVWLTLLGVPWDRLGRRVKNLKFKGKLNSKDTWCWYREDSCVVCVTLTAGMPTGRRLWLTASIKSMWYITNLSSILALYWLSDFIRLANHFNWIRRSIQIYAKLIGH